MFFHYLELEDMIDKNPMRNVDLTKKAIFLSSQGKEVKAKCDEITVFTPEEIEQLKAVADILGHTATEITELYYVKRDSSKLEGLTDEFNL